VIKPTPSSNARRFTDLIERIDAATTTGQEVADLIPKFTAVKRSSFSYDIIGSNLTYKNVSKEFTDKDTVPNGYITPSAVKGLLDQNGQENDCIMMDADTMTMAYDDVGNGIYGRLVYTDLLGILPSDIVTFVDGSPTVLGASTITFDNLEVGDVIKHPDDTDSNYYEITEITVFATTSTLTLAQLYSGTFSSVAGNLVPGRRWRLNFFFNQDDDSLVPNAASNPTVDTLTNIMFFYREVVDLNSMPNIDRLFDAMILYG
ncbi:unnamed protein product, partial [marine sediment metagenome]